MSELHIPYLWLYWAGFIVGLLNFLYGIIVLVFFPTPDQRLWYVMNRGPASLFAIPESRFPWWVWILIGLVIAMPFAWVLFF